MLHNLKYSFQSLSVFFVFALFCNQSWSTELEHLTNLNSVGITKEIADTLEDETIFSKDLVKSGRSTYASQFKWNGFGDQNEYALQFRASIEQAKRALIEYNWNLNQVLEFLAYKRYQIAIRLGQTEADSFGKRRNLGRIDWTPLHCKYHFIVDKIYSETSRSENCKPDPTRGYPILRYYEASTGSRDYKVETFSFFAPLDNDKKIRLTGYMLQTGFSYHFENERLFGRSDRGAILIHTNPEAHREILEHLESLFLKIRDEANTHPKDAVKVIDPVARISWWLAHAMFFQRGSAAITEMLVHALLEMNGIVMPELQEGSMMDLEALSETQEENYVSKFKAWF